MRRLFFYYEEVCRKKEERIPKTLLWENAKPSLPGSPCHCRCYAIALCSVAVVAVAVVTLPPARHAGAAIGEKQFQQILLLILLLDSFTYSLINSLADSLARFAHWILSPDSHCGFARCIHC